MESFPNREILRQISDFVHLIPVTYRDLMQILGGIESVLLALHQK